MGRIGDASLHLTAKFPRKGRQAAECGRNQRFQASADEACQHRRGSAGGDRRQHRGTIDDDRHDEAAQGGVVDDIHGHAAGVRELGRTGIDRTVVAGRDDQLGSGEIRFLEWACAVADAPGVQQRLHAVTQIRRCYLHPGAGLQQQIGLARRYFPASHDQAAPLAQIEKDGQIIHGRVRVTRWFSWCESHCPAGSECVRMSRRAVIAHTHGKRQEWR